ncbi:MAG: hypothetical protein ACYTKD_26700 [Planctomycetota bacterium]|jgi:hypothetical protein
MGDLEFALGEGAALSKDTWPKLAKDFEDSLYDLWRTLKPVREFSLSQLVPMIEECSGWFSETTRVQDRLLCIRILEGAYNALSDIEDPEDPLVDGYLLRAAWIAREWYLGKEVEEAAWDELAETRAAEGKELFLGRTIGQCLSLAGSQALVKSEELVQKLADSVSSIDEDVAKRCARAPRCSQCFAALRLLSAAAGSVATFPGSEPEQRERLTEFAGLIQDVQATIMTWRTCDVECSTGTRLIGNECAAAYDKLLEDDRISLSFISPEWVSAFFDIAKMSRDNAPNAYLVKLVQILLRKLGDSSWNKLRPRTRVVLCGLLRDYARFPDAPGDDDLNWAMLSNELADLLERGESCFKDRMRFPDVRPTCTLSFTSENGDDIIIPGTLLEASCCGMRVASHGWESWHAEDGQGRRGWRLTRVEEPAKDAVVFLEEGQDVGLGFNGGSDAPPAMRVEHH